MFSGDPAEQHKVVQHLARYSETDISDYKGASLLFRMGFGETRKIPGFPEKKAFFTTLIELLLYYPAHTEIVVNRMRSPDSQAVKPGV